MSDAPKLFAKPRQPKVPLPPSDPRSATASPYLPSEGEEVEDIPWWHRLAQQGDVDLTELKAPKNALSVTQVVPVQVASSSSGSAAKAGA